MPTITYDRVCVTTRAMRRAPKGTMARELCRPILREQVLIERYRWIRDRTPSLADYARADRTYALVVERLFAGDLSPERRGSN